ncbi:MAG TPA: type II toxin-antitoxin system Phd/YefM family antitoxin [Thermoanaerobaculia bacterium]|nr:type II toxin-antitoxin system Phd/YefM family antitoxin [Thermoanaerobaculia bacterium]
MDTFNIHQAKTQLSKLVQRVESGEEIVIARGGKPVARLVPLAPARPRFGLDRGKLRIADDFDAPLPDEIVNEFYR